MFSEMKFESDKIQAAYPSKTDVTKSDTLVVVWEYRPSRDVDARIDSAFEILLGNALDALSDSRRTEYNVGIHFHKQSIKHP